jgi:hypothetical protein
VSRDKSVRRSAQDDDFVGVLKKNIPNKLALMGVYPGVCPGYVLAGRQPWPKITRLESRD